MKSRTSWSSVVALFLALAPTALGSNTWYVDGVNGNDNNDCKTRQTACKTIGHAISLASSGDTIGIGPATYTENLTIFQANLTLTGVSAPSTIIDGGGVGTVVTLSSSTANVTLSRITIRNGSVGGIFSPYFATLTINSSTISGNSVGGQGGGGIYNNGTLTIKNSTLTSNIANNGVCSPREPCWGGGILNRGTVVISNSTLSGNSARTAGGGIFNFGVVSISSSTISDNSGGGIDMLPGTPPTTIQNSIVSNNFDGNCSGAFTSKGYNISSDGSCHFREPGDLNNTDPKLGPLQNNGGPTQTQVLLSGSPAIDAGNPNGCTDGNGHLLKTDQRGAPRPDKEDTGGCDMGAFERQSD